MNRRTASRNSTTIVLVLFLAGVAAPAVAMPPGPPAPGGAAWDVGGFLGWLHSLAPGLFGLGVDSEGVDRGPGAVYDQSRAVLDPNGNSNDLTAESSDGEEEESPMRDDRPMPK